MNRSEEDRDKTITDFADALMHLGYGSETFTEQHLEAIKNGGELIKEVPLTKVFNTLRLPQRMVINSELPPKTISDQSEAKRIKQALAEISQILKNINKRYNEKNNVKERYNEKNNVKRLIIELINNQINYFADPAERAVENFKLVNRLKNAATRILPWLKRLAGRTRPKPFSPKNHDRSKNR